MSALADPPVGRLTYSPDEDDLRDAVRTLLTRRAPWPDVLARTESGEPVDRALWRTLAADLGCAGLPVGEEFGGAGAGWGESAVVAEELGRAVAPIPFLGSTVAIETLLRLGEHDLAAQAVVGDRVVALAVPWGTAPHDPLPAPLRADATTLSGAIPAIGDAAAADVLLVPAGDALLAVDVAAPGVSVRAAGSLDMTRPVCDVVLDRATGRPIGRGPDVAAAVRHALVHGAVLLAAEQLGIARRCLDLTVEHPRERRQFGRTLGSYQALKHRLADLWVQITQAGAVSRHAAAAATARSADLPVAAALAQAHCSTVVVAAAHECVQLHGGIGFTWEHPVHLYLKRARSTALILGSAERHRAALADLLALPGGEPV